MIVLNLKQFQILQLPMSSKQSRPIFRPGKSIGNYCIKRLVGQGGYGDIYEAYDQVNQKSIGMKVELLVSKKKALKREYDIIQNLHSPYFPEHIDYQETEQYKYLCMELCGPSISTIRKITPNRILEPSTILRVSIEMLRAIQEFHEAGYLHRDIKPSNFLIRPSRKYPICLIDYGLSCTMDYERNECLRSNEHLRFVGTSKYASLRAHAGKELGRRDDLYSWFLSIIELWIGRLPWASSNDKQKIYEIKRSTDITKLIEPLPKPMLSVYKLIRRLNTEDKPDYDLIISFIVEAMKEIGASWFEPFQWEKMDVSEFSALPTLSPPDDELPNIPTDLPEPVIPPMEFVPFANQRKLSYSNGRRDQLWLYRNFKPK